MARSEISASIKWRRPDAVGRHDRDRKIDGRDKGAQQIDEAFATLARERPDALFIAPDSFFGGRRVQLANLAARYRIPAANSTREAVAAGGLMSYGPDILDSLRQVGAYTGQILKGAKPADLPVVQSTKFEFVINLQTAKLLGIEVPETLLAIADEVIQ